MNSIERLPYVFLRVFDRQNYSYFVHYFLFFQVLPFLILHIKDGDILNFFATSIFLNLARNIFLIALISSSDSFLFVRALFIEIFLLCASVSFLPIRVLTKAIFDAVLNFSLIFIGFIVNTNL